MDCSMTGFPVHYQLLKFTQTHVHQVSDAIKLLDPVFLSPAEFNLSQYNSLFQWVSYSHQVARVLEFPFQNQCFQWIFRIDFLFDWLIGLLAIQGTLKSFLQHHNSKVWILRCSALFIVQISYPYTPTRKNTALTRWTFLGKVMSLLFNMLSRLIIGFLTRSKGFIHFTEEPPSALILEPPK